MSGGSFNYLYNSDVCDLFNRIDDLSTIGRILCDEGYFDISYDILKLITFIYYSQIKLDRLFNRLIPVLKAVEFFDSSDINHDELIDILNSYKHAE